MIDNGKIVEKGVVRGITPCSSLDHDALALSEPLPFKSRTFDVIMGSAILLYLGEQGLVSLLKELH